MLNYTVILEPDEMGRGYTVLVPALPGCITQGRSKEEALDRAREAIRCHIESLQKDGLPVPVEKAPVELASVQLAEVRG